MNINFAWIDPADEVGSLQNREDEKIFHLEIGQKEAGVAYARVTIQNPGYGLLWPPDKQSCVIAFDAQPVFRGRLIAMPGQIDGELVTLSFTAAPADTEEKKQALCDAIKGEGPYDALFVGARPELRDLLQGQSRLPYWHPVTGEVVLSDILRGRQQLNIGERFFRDSLKVSVIQEPLSCIKCELNAEWLQQARGVCEIGQHIKNACPKGYLSTLTPDSLEKAWWPDGIRQNGYQVLNSKLIPLKPLDKNRFAETTPELWQGGDKPRQVRFPMNWYDVQLKLGWTYRQKRRETARFQLKHSVQNVGGNAHREKTLVFNLASIVGKNAIWQPDHIYTPGFVVLYQDQVYRCIKRHQSGSSFNPKKWLLLENHMHVDGQAARSTFFSTERGQQAIAYALEVAKAHLAASARCINIQITSDLRHLKDITLDHTLTIHDPRLPGGDVQGKVTGYRFIIDGSSGERIGEVTLGVAIGTGVSTTQELADQDTYAVEDVWEENPPLEPGIYGRSRSALCFHIPAGQEPPMGIRQPTLLSELDLLQQVDLRHDGEKQSRRLARRQYPAHPDLKSILQGMPTDIRLRLKDLSTQACLDHTIDVNVLTTWSAPQQINLAAGPIGGGA